MGTPTSSHRCRGGLGWEARQQREDLNRMSSASGLSLSPFVSAGHCVHRSNPGEKLSRPLPGMLGPPTQLKWDNWKDLYPRLASADLLVGHQLLACCDLTFRVVADVHVAQAGRAWPGSSPPTPNSLSSTS